MNERYSVPGAILLAGALIAGAIVFTQVRLPASRTPDTSPTPTAAQAVPSPTATPEIVVRPVDAARDHIRGTETASVTLVEYSDLECPFCKTFHRTLLQAMQDSDGKIRWVYRHFPITQLHAKAPKEAEAAECAGEQGKFWEYVDRVFEVTPSNDGLDPKELPVIARGVGINLTKFEECLASGRYAALVREDLADSARAGARGTPHTVILGPKGEKVPFCGAQPYANLKQAIDLVFSGTTISPQQFCPP